jgi:hypothetical protein
VGPRPRSPIGEDVAAGHSVSSYGRGPFISKRKYPPNSDPAPATANSSRPNQGARVQESCPAAKQRDEPVDHSPCRPKELPLPGAAIDPKTPPAPSREGDVVHVPVSDSSEKSGPAPGLTATDPEKTSMSVLVSEKERSQLNAAPSRVSAWNADRNERTAAISSRTLASNHERCVKPLSSSNLPGGATSGSAVTSIPARTIPRSSDLRSRAALTATPASAPASKPASALAGPLSSAHPPSRPPPSRPPVLSIAANTAQWALSPGSVLGMRSDASTEPISPAIEIGISTAALEKRLPDESIESRDAQLGMSTKSSDTPCVVSVARSMSSDLASREPRHPDRDSVPAVGKGISRPPLRPIPIPSRPSHPLGPVPLSRLQPSSPAACSPLAESIDSILQRIAKVNEAIGRVDGRIYEIQEMDHTNRESNSNMVRGCLETTCPDKQVNGTALCDASSQARALAKRFDVNRDVDPPLRRVFLQSDRSLLDILKDNRSRAAASSDALKGLCSNMELGLDPSHICEVVPLASVSDVVAERVRQTIVKRRAQRDLRNRELTKEYLDLSKAWTRKNKQARDKRSKEKREMCRERDRFLYRSIMGENALLQARTSSGRTTTRVVGVVTAGGLINYAAEIDASLAEIESHGGTPGLNEVWDRTLATIPMQRADILPLDCGSVLIEDPVKEVHNSRSINPWTREETYTFLDKFVLHPKNFKRIASFLEYKSLGDVIEFYYRNKLRFDLKSLSTKKKVVKKAHLLSLAGLRRAPESAKQRPDSSMRPDGLVYHVLDPHEGDKKLGFRRIPSPRATDRSTFVDQTRSSPAPSGEHYATIAEANSSYTRELSSSPRLGRATRSQVREAEERERRASLDGVSVKAKSGGPHKYESDGDNGNVVNARSKKMVQEKTTQFANASGNFCLLQSDTAGTADDATNVEGVEGRAVGGDEPDGKVIELGSRVDCNEDAAPDMYARTGILRVVVASPDKFLREQGVRGTTDSGAVVSQSPSKTEVETGTSREEFKTMLKETAVSDGLGLRSGEEGNQHGDDVAMSGTNEAFCHRPEGAVLERALKRSDHFGGRKSPSNSAVNSENSARKQKTALWTSQEVSNFEKHFADHGKDWKRISSLMATKSPAQVKGYWRRRDAESKARNVDADDGREPRNDRNERDVAQEHRTKDTCAKEFAVDSGAGGIDTSLASDFVISASAARSSTVLADVESMSADRDATRLKATDRRSDWVLPREKEVKQTISWKPMPLRSQPVEAQCESISPVTTRDDTRAAHSPPRRGRVSTATKDSTILIGSGGIRTDERPGRKRDAAAAELDDPHAVRSKREISFPSSVRGSASDPCRETARQNLAHEAEHVGMEADRVPAALAAVAASRVVPIQEKLKAGSMSLNLNLLTPGPNAIVTKPGDPGPGSARTLSAPRDIRNSSLGLPKFRSMPLQSASGGTLNGMPHSAPVASVAQDKHELGFGRPLPSTARIPPNVSLIQQSSSPASVAGGAGTPRSSGSSRLQELLKKARAAGFISRKT